MGFAVPLAVKRNNSKMMLEILNFMYHLHCKLNILWLSFVKVLQGKLYALTRSLAILPNNLLKVDYWAKFEGKLYSDAKYPGPLLQRSPLKC